METNGELSQLQSPTSVKKTDKPNYSRETIQNTPFIKSQDTNGWCLAIGVRRVTEYYETEELLLAATAIVLRMDWNHLTAVICTLATTANELNNEIEKLTNN